MFNIVSIDAFNRVEQLYEYATEMEDCVPILYSVTSKSCWIMCEVRARRSMLGRPALAIEEEKLCFYVDNGFRVEDIALMFSCSKRTIERRLSAYHLSTRNYSVITDVELDDLVKEMCAVFPRCGEKLVYGTLRA